MPEKIKRTAQDMARLGRPLGSKNKPKVPKPSLLRPAMPNAGRPQSKGGKEFLLEVAALGGLPGDESLDRLKQIRSPAKKSPGTNRFPLEQPASNGLPGVTRPAGQTSPGTVQGLPPRSQAELVARIAASGLTPLDYMLSILRDTSQSKIRRDWAAERCAPYCHSRLASVVHTGKGGGPIQTLDLSKISDEQLAVLETIFGAIVQSGGHPGGAAEGADST